MNDVMRRNWQLKHEIFLWNAEKQWRNEENIWIFLKIFKLAKFCGEIRKFNLIIFNSMLLLFYLFF